eukprot:gene8702-8883_t
MEDIILNFEERDVPARDPKKDVKPFLRRGQGVQKRLDAYKYRKAPKQQQEREQEQQQQQTPEQSAWCDQSTLTRKQSKDHAESTPSGRSGPSPAPSDQTSLLPWSIRQAQEDLELEEFRVLEQEILGTRSQQQLPPQTGASNVAADLSGTSASEAIDALPAAGLTASTSNSCHEVGSQLQAQNPPGSDVDSAYDDLGLHFEDNTEWQLEAAEATLQQERGSLRKMRVDVEKAANRLQQEQQAWERQRAAAQASLEAWRSDEARRLARERRVLEQQSKALLKLPSKKEKSSLEALEGQLEKERADGRAAAARHRLTVERLRSQIKELQDRAAELREEVRWHEAQALSSTSFAAQDKARRKPPCSSVQTQTDVGLDKQQQQNRDSGAGATAGQVAAGPAALPMSQHLYAALFEDDDATSAEDEQAAAPAAVLDNKGPNARCCGSGVVSAGPAASTAVNGPTAPRSPAAKTMGGNSSAGTSNSSGLHQRLNGRKITNCLTFATTAQDPSSQQQQKRQAAVGSLSASDDAPVASGNHLLGNSSTGGPSRVAVTNEDSFTFAPVPAGHSCSSGSRSGGASAVSSTLDFDQLAAGRQPLQQIAKAKGAAGAVTPPAGGNHLSEGVLSAAVGSATAAGMVGATAMGRAAAASTLLDDPQQQQQQQQAVADGTQVTQYPNGALKLSLPDGSSYICFSNGDVKQRTTCGRVDYYYAEVATWQSSHPGGVEVFYFPTGQVEAHHPDDSKEIIFPDGAVHRVLEDGCEEKVPISSLSEAVRLPPPEFLL